MKATLRGISGPAIGTELALDSGVTLSIGRNATCDISFPADTVLSRRHCEIIVSDDHVLLRDLGSANGTFLSGTRVQERILRPGESFQAGRSTFQLESGAMQLPTVLEVLSNQPEPLYAVLDAARDPAIYPLLITSGEQYICLYSGDAALKLEAVAPYLVLLPPYCELLKTIVTQGWSKAWGIFLTSSKPPQTIWHELRRSLMVTLETTQKLVYFRFYDPRVLREFLSIAEPKQAVELYGSISSLLFEDKEAKAVICIPSLLFQGTDGNYNGSEDWSFTKISI